MDYDMYFASGTTESNIIPVIGVIKAPPQNKRIDSSTKRI